MVAGEEYDAEALSNEAKRGTAWVLLGAARLHLAAPPPGADPAAKYAHKRDHLLALLDDVLAELDVSRSLPPPPISIHVIKAACLFAACRPCMLPPHREHQVRACEPSHSRAG